MRMIRSLTTWRSLAYPGQGDRAAPNRTWLRNGDDTCIQSVVEETKAGEFEVALAYHARWRVTPQLQTL